MGAVTPGETLGTLYTSNVGTNKTKQHGHRDRDGPVTVTVTFKTVNFEVDSQPRAWPSQEEEEEEEFIRIHGYYRGDPVEPMSIT